MLRSLKDLRGYGLRAQDGDIGKVHDFFFDDETWIIRYFVVDLGSHLSDRKVLLSPLAMGKPEWKSLRFPVAHSREQVEQSPDVDTDQPISRRHELELSSHYGWIPYWPVPDLGVSPFPVRVPLDREDAKNGEGVKSPEETTHLRSAREITGYHIGASDGDIGHVEDFIAETDAWTIRYVVADTRNWLPGKRVLLAPDWITAMDWASRKVTVSMTREEVRESPEFDPGEPVNRDYEVSLYDYYGRPKYW